MSAPRDEDPFRDARRDRGVLAATVGDETIALILRYLDVRRAAQDVATYSSDAPRRVPVPSEEEARPYRQLPIETDPPEHTAYKAVVRDFFRRPTQPAYIAKVEDLVAGMVREAVAGPPMEFVQEFAVPLQSRALTFLLNVPMEEADLWITWGAHALHDPETPLAVKGGALVRYIEERIDHAAARPGEDLYSALSRATIDGRALTREEIAGFVHLAFAGGRDTIINVLTGAVVYFAQNEGELARIKADPALATSATEEFVRYFSPLTMIGRVCPHGADVHGVPVAADARAALCWASANFDETVFEAPHELRLDRRPNPHVGFGSGAHACLGAPQARLIIRTFLTQLAQSVGRIEAADIVRRVERTDAFERANGFERVTVTFTPA